jgi:hypothetical protein
MSKWRECARQMIEKALEEGREAGLGGKELERFISARYPWGPRKNHPYQIWLDEFARQVRGRRSSEGHARPRDLPGQGILFGELP